MTDAELLEQFHQLKQEFTTEIRASEERVKTELEEKITKEIKASEKRHARKLHKAQNAILKYHDEYAIFLRGRIEKLEEKAGIVHFKN